MARLKTHDSQLATRGFTLTELLVVIAIIAILASLITAAAVGAMKAKGRTVILVEIGQLADAAERFKTNFGGAYPPNAMNGVSGDTSYKGTDIYNQTINDFIRSFRKAFPRNNEPEGLLRRLAGQTGSLPAGNPSQLQDADGDNVGGGMNAAEAVYFWLGGFSADPIYPISGPGGPSFGDGDDSGTSLDLSDEILENRTVQYEFVLPQLGPRDDDGFFDENEGRFVTYEVLINGVLQQRRINLWTYHPRGFESSFVYFDTSRHDPESYDLDLSGKLAAKIYALKKVREGLGESVTPTTRDIDFVNKGKYQIMHPGLDDTWGSFEYANIFTASSASDASNLLLYPTGPFTGDIADTLTNFSNGTLEARKNEREFGMRNSEFGIV